MHTTHLCRLVLVLAKKFDIPAALKSFSLRHRRSSNQDIYWTWRVIYYIDGETVNRVNLNFLQKLKYFMLLIQKFFLVLNFEDEKVYPCEVCSEELFLTDKIFNLHTTWRSIKFKSKRLPFPKPFPNLSTKPLHGLLSKMNENLGILKWTNKYRWHSFRNSVTSDHKKLTHLL